ncbi:hypothetical protein [Tissierella praeacuta]|uniref:hypothetical protein n=1 Tax=Tissierella praeacuta TaxID=43131 RepID=UPI003341D342
MNRLFSNDGNLKSFYNRTVEKREIVRQCIPFDYGTSRKYKYGFDRYHFYTLNSPEGNHNLSVLPDQVLNIELMNKTFDPADYIKWKPNWIIDRDWGDYS